MPGVATQESVAIERKRSSDADQEENTMRLQKHSFAAMGLAGVLAGFAGISVVQAENADVTYKAELPPLNSKTTGFDARGEATFTISGDQLTIHVSAKGVSPNMEHLQHLHGFAKGDRKSICPRARNDANGDGIIDLIETDSVAGTTMVPFHDDPVSMEMVKDTYPAAGTDGAIRSLTAGRANHVAAATRFISGCAPNVASVTALMLSIIVIRSI